MDEKGLLKKTNLGPVWFLLIICAMMFHGCVVKAQRIIQLKSCYDLRDTNVAEYGACKDRITYFSALTNLKEVFGAWN